MIVFFLIFWFESLKIISLLYPLCFQTCCIWYGKSESTTNSITSKNELLPHMAFSNSIFLTGNVICDDNYIFTQFPIGYHHKHYHSKFWTSKSKKWHVAITHLCPVVFVLLFVVMFHFSITFLLSLFHLATSHEPFMLSSISWTWMVMIVPFLNLQQVHLHFLSKLCLMVLCLVCLPLIFPYPMLTWHCTMVKLRWTLRRVSLLL